MKYSKQIVILMTINLIIAFLLIFIGHKTRQIEVSNLNLEIKIKKINQQIDINKIEYTFHTNSEYLKKLYELYHPSIENYQDHKIISFNQFSNQDKANIFLVDY
jgi:hypothetical protein